MCETPEVMEAERAFVALSSETSESPVREAISSGRAPDAQAPAKQADGCVSRRRNLSNISRRLTVDGPRRLIIDYIDKALQQETNVSEASCSSMRHPAQEVQTPEAVLSVWGSATTPADRFLPFFANKRMNFDGEFANIRHRIGIMSHRGYKPDMPNQDDFFILARADSVLLGVLDGHGPEGHDVSHFAQERLPKHITERLREDPEAWATAVQASVEELCCQAKAEITEKAHYSGTTATIAMLDQPDCADSPGGGRAMRLRCAWLGDSSAVWAKRKSKTSSWEVVNLVDVHRPDRAEELQRIELAGGTVSVSHGKTPARLLTPEWNLALSRSLGDFHAVPYGLSSEPELGKELWLEPEYEHLILVCSDGVWDVMDPQQAVKFVAKFSPNEAQLAVERLVSKAQRRWQETEDVVDDITAMLLWPGFLEEPGLAAAPN